MSNKLSPFAILLTVSLFSGCSTPQESAMTKEPVKEAVAAEEKKPEAPAVVKEEKAPVSKGRFTERTIYPDSSKSSYLGDNKELMLNYGIEGGKGFYTIKNISQTGYLVTVKFNDGSEARHEVHPHAVTEVVYFEPTENISNWEMKTWTTREKIDKNGTDGITFGWRTYKGEMQFRLHNSNTIYKDVEYYYESDGPATKKLLKVMPKGASNWQPYKGGNIVTNFSK